MASIKELEVDQSDMQERLTQVNLALKDAKQKPELLNNPDFKTNHGQMVSESKSIEKKINENASKLERLNRNKQQNTLVKQKLESQAGSIDDPNNLIDDLQALIDAVDISNLEIAEYNQDIKNSDQQLKDLEK